MAASVRDYVCSLYGYSSYTLFFDELTPLIMLQVAVRLMPAAVAIRIIVVFLL